MTEKGHISIHTENILPIIKKWLYSEKEIFLRELVSNAADALTKLGKLAMIGEAAEAPEASITISIDKNAKTLSITDTGIGLTAEEIKKYINQVAFSGVKDFVEKYQGKDDDHQVIGHFGLGFYSTFMVADKVEIASLSHQAGAKGAHWVCDGSTDYTLEEIDRKDIGTTITLHISEDGQEMLEAHKIQDILNKYCAFIRYPIHMDGKVINDPRPIWTKNQSELKENDYKEFFSKVFPLAKEPLFWIHLNVDYPFKLRGVLYFPQLKHELDASQGEVKLYCNQVYVADNPKELLPDFLTLLKGVIDCPDLPLNVSRSYLQNDPQAMTIRTHIVKKVADRLTGMAKTEKELYEKYWDDIHPFIKYGMMRDQKFYERMKDHLIFKSSQGGYTTLDAYHERMKDRLENKVIYATNPSLQASYLAMLKENQLEAITTDSMIDQHFLPYLEMQLNRKFIFQRVDSDVLSQLVESSSDSKIVDPKDNKTTNEKIEELFKKYLKRDNLKFRIEALKSSKVPAMLVLDENTRRMQEMSSMGDFSAFLNAKDSEQTLVVNRNSDAVKNLLAQANGLAPDPKKLEMVVHHIFDLAFIQNGKFSPQDMQAFIERSALLLGHYKATEVQP